MKRLGKYALLLVPLTVLAIACVKSYQMPFKSWPFPAQSYAPSLFQGPKYLLAAVAGLFAPMPLCLAAGRRVGRRGGVADVTGVLVAQLSVLVAVGLGEFFGLVALGLATKGAFLATQAAVCAAGLVVLRRQNAGRGAGPVLEGVKSYLSVVGSLAACGLASAHFGADCGCDIFNYHYYNGFAFLNGRHALDFAVADKESYFNPLPDVAYYLLVRNVRPVWAGFIAGSVHGLAVPLLLGVAYEVLGRAGALRAGRAPLAAACAVAGACEPMFLAQLGTTFADALLTSFVLAAVLTAVRMVGNGDEIGRVRAGWLAVLAGAFLGVATGLKLTAATYAVAMVLALAAVPGGWRRGLGLAAAFSAGAGSGFLVTNGFWMADLYARFGNPIFPLYNSVFRSPYWGNEDLSYHYFSAGFRWYDHLLVPFYLARNRPLLAEVASVDPRLAVATVLLLLAGLGRLVDAMRADWRSVRAVRERLKGPLPPAATLLVVFAVASYVVWYVEFRYLRYLTVVKVIAPLVCVLLVLDLLRAGRRVWVASSALLVLTTCGVETCNFGRRDWKTTYLDFQFSRPVGIERGVVLLSAVNDRGNFSPYGALAAELPGGLRFIKIDSPQVAGTTAAGQPLAMGREVLEFVRNDPGPFYVVAHKGPNALGAAAKALERYHLAIAEGAEPTWVTTWCRDLGVWRLERRPDRAAEVAVTPAPGVPR